MLEPQRGPSVTDRCAAFQRFSSAQMERSRAQMKAPFHSLEPPFAQMETPLSSLEVPFSSLEPPFAQMETPLSAFGASICANESFNDLFGSSIGANGVF